MSGINAGLLDVAIIGGGPAGATAATLLAQRGRRVAVFEKAAHPRFHIGESLLPKNLPILERLGVLDEVRGIGIHKPGAEFISPDHDRRESFLFSEALDPEPPHAYQVERSQFDEILLNNARASGADVRENCAVSDIRFEGAQQTVSILEAGCDSTVRAKLVLDATGRDGFLARRLGIRNANKDHNSAAIFAHFDGIPDDAWDVTGSIALFWFEHGWFWMIPLAEGKTSIGAVCMPDYLRSRRGALDDFFFDTIRLCPKLWAIVRRGELASPVRGAGNYSYRASRAFGPGYLMIGDAYAFVDPVFSSGVYLAMSGAERAVEAVDQMLDRPERADRLFAAYQRQIDRSIGKFAWFIYRFNTPALRSMFMGPRNVLGMRQAVISMLAGDVYVNRGLSWRLALFKVFYGAFWLLALKRSLKLESRRTQLASIRMPEDEVAGNP